MINFAPHNRIKNSPDKGDGVVVNSTEAHIGAVRSAIHKLKTMPGKDSQIADDMTSELDEYLRNTPSPDPKVLEGMRDRATQFATWDAGDEL